MVYPQGISHVLPCGELALLGVGGELWGTRTAPWTRNHLAHSAAPLTGRGGDFSLSRLLFKRSVWERHPTYSRRLGVKGLLRAPPPPSSSRGEGGQEQLPDKGGRSSLAPRCVDGGSQNQVQFLSCSHLAGQVTASGSRIDSNTWPLGFLRADCLALGVRLGPPGARLVCSFSPSGVPVPQPLPFHLQDFHVI